MAAAAREGSSLQRGTSSRSVPLFSFPPSRLVRASSRRGPHAAEGPVGPAACPQGSSSSPGDPLGTKVLWAQGAEPVPLLPRRMQASDARVWYLRSPITPAAAGGCGNVSFPQLRAAALLLFKHAEQEPSLQPQLSPPCPVLSSSLALQLLQIRRILPILVTANPGFQQALLRAELPAAAAAL